MTDPSLSRLDRIVAQFRQAIMDRDDQAIRRLMLAYADVHRAMVDALRRAHADQDAFAKLRRRRLQSLITQLQAIWQPYATLAADIITDLQQQGYLAGAQYAQQTLDLIAADAAGVQVQARLDTLNEQAIISAVGALQEGSPVRDILRTLGNEVAERVAALIVESVTTGASPRDTGRRIQQVAGIGLHRATTIARTEHMRAMRAGTLDRYQASGIVRAWQWRASPSRRTCIVCLAMDGTEYPLQTPFPTHPNCRCTMIPIVHRPPQRQTGNDWLRQQDRATQDAILGPTLARAWRDGTLEIRDVVELRTDPTWGAIARQRSIREIERLRDMRYERAEQTRRALIRDASQIQQRISEISNRIKVLLAEVDDLESRPQRTERQKRRLYRLMEEVDALIYERARLQQQVRELPLRVLRAESASLSVTAPNGTSPSVEQGIDLFRRLAPRLPASTVGVVVDDTCQREFYSMSRDDVVLHPSSPPRTVIHELGHWWETHDPRIHDACVAFLLRRTRGERPVALRDLFPQSRYRDDEVALPDKFLHPYVGKVYPGYYATEVLSMGLEMMATDPLRLADEDPEWFVLIASIIDPLEGES